MAEYTKVIDRESVGYALRQMFDDMPEDDRQFAEVVDEFISHYLDWLP